MSSLQSVFVKFKDHLKIPGNIAILKKQEKKIKIVVYCLEKDILINNKLMYLNFLYRLFWTYIHELFWMNYYPFELTKIISVNKNHWSTHVFASRKY